MGAMASEITSLTSVYSTGLFRRRPKKTFKLRVTGLWEGNSPGTGEFPSQMASNAENVSIWWRHHHMTIFSDVPLFWHITHSETIRSSGWLFWSSLGTLKLALNVSSEDQGSHRDGLSVSLYRHSCLLAVLLSWLFIMTSSNGNIFRVTGPLCGEFTGHLWVPLTKASDAELWCFLWSVPN